MLDATPRKILQFRAFHPSGCLVAHTGERMAYLVCRPLTSRGRAGRAVDEDARDGGAHEVGQRGRGDAAHAELGDVATTVRGEPTQAAEEDAEGAEVGEAGEREGDDGAALVGEFPRHRTEVGEGDELVDHRLLADEAAGSHGLVPGDADEEHDRGEDPAQDRLEGQVGVAESPAMSPMMRLTRAMREMKTSSIALMLRRA